MKKIKEERILFTMTRAIPSVINKLKNHWFSLIFNTKNLRLGKNVSFSGTKNIKIGTNVLLGNQTWIDAIGTGIIEIGNNVSCSQNVHIASACVVKIGDGCLIGSDVLITDHDHMFGDEFLYIEPKDRGLKIKGSTEIGQNSWLGDNVKILSGIKLGCNVVVAANSVVINDFPSNSVIGGIPARPLLKSMSVD